MAKRPEDGSQEIHELNDYQGSDEDQYHKNVTKGGTAVDSQEMRRMGRVQELRVCATFRELEPAACCIVTSLPAQLQIR
jgi:hypothetical protein